ncbi:MAG: Methylcobamide:CoM methyltransferase MtbA [Methanomassiliicoccales archaeon PtaU1.Bin124]|nr:MAG: Methylcobamide:CoM methyltransferase MtbA [Methanomassiliicoccales archaeon PtaU1.Bin124]
MKAMSSMERVLTSLQHKEPDRVPLLLSLTMHGAKMQGVSIQKYFSSPQLMAEAQVRMWKKYESDFLNSFTYSSAEVEAFGGSTIFYEDGPPNSGEPVIQALEDIESLEPPDVQTVKSLMVTIEATRRMKAAVGEEVPILGVTISPFSLPVMQMGFENYFDLLYSDMEHFRSLMKVNTEFQLQYANMLVEAGATAIVYFDPLSSTTIIPRAKFLETGFNIARDAVKRMHGPIVAHFASGRILPIVDKIIEAGFIGVSASVDEDLKILKKLAGGKLTLIGNLNGMEMPNWTAEQIDQNVRSAISDGARGGGFVLCDNHGEIPYQVSDETIQGIADASRKYGKYPLKRT